MTIADKLKQIKQSTDAIKASATALTGEVQTDLTSIAIILDTANPANATDILNMLGYTSTNAPELYNAFLNSLNKEEGATYENDNAVLLPKLTLDEDGIYQIKYRSMFRNSTILTIPKGKYYLDNSSNSFLGMFQNCANLLWVPDVELCAADTYDGSYMFQGCTGLKTVGNLNTEGCTNMYYMFDGCSNLVSIASLNTSNVTNMASTFKDCSSLVNIPQIDYSKVPWMPYTFSGCSSFTEVPDLNLESATYIPYMFNYCTSLVTVGSLNTPNVTDVSSLFGNCTKLERVASLDVRSVTNSSPIFGYGTLPIRYMVFKNLGQSSLTSWTFGYLTSWGVNNDTHPDAKQSVIDTLITYSYDRASAGMSACNITLNKFTKEVLTEDEIAQITAKGFTIS